MQKLLGPFSQNSAEL